MHLPRRLGRAALAFVVGAAVAPALSAQGSRNDISATPEVHKLEFRGVSKAIDLTDLEARIYTTATRCRSFLLAPICAFTNYRGFEERHYLDHQELARDVLRIKVYYYQKGYRETQVDTAVSVLNDKEVAVRFDIVEGLPTIVSSVKVVYDSTLLAPKKVRSLTLLHAGEPLDLFAMDTMRVNFQNALWELGYADALVDTSSVVNDTARTALVQFRLVPNHLTTISSIVITGTNRIAPRTVQNLLSFRQGDLYRRSSVLESQRSLYESNLFKLAAVDVPQTFDSAKTVNVLLRESPLHEARVSFGFNTVDYFQTEGRFTDYNLLGGARRLDVTGTLGNLMAGSLNGKGIFHKQNPDTTITGSAAAFLQPTWEASISLTQPAFLSAVKNSLALTAFAQRRSLPAVYIDRGYGGDVTFTRTVGIRAPISLSYRFEVTRVEANPPYFCVNFGVCDTTTINTLVSHQRLSPILLQGQVDRSDTPLNPSTGYRAHAELESASRYTVSDYAYNRVYADGSLYHRMGGRNSVLAFHVRLGFVRPMTGLNGDNVHPRKRFYAGGSQSVRGYGENQLGPRILTLPHGYLIHAVDVNGNPCDASSEAIRFCDPNTARDSVPKKGTTTTFPTVGDDKFTPRPLGGTSLLEGSAEYRFPLPLIKSLQGAVFVDGAVVGENVLNPLEGVSTLANLVKGNGAITPGFGVRYLSPVGPIRVDMGFNPSRSEKLAVVSEIEKNGKRVIIPLETPRQYSPTGSSSGGFHNVLNRLTLHLSIGQAW